MKLKTFDGSIENDIYAFNKHHKSFSMSSHVDVNSLFTKNTSMFASESIMI